MLRKLGMLCVAACVWVGVVLPSSASAETMTWHIKSNYPYKVQIEFYSMDRNAAWPGGSKAYDLNDYNTKTFNLNCQRGERICYGAWVSGNASKYWGGGLHNRQHCPDCCGRCGDGYMSRVLNP